MVEIIKDTSMADNTYTGWALYTGARHAASLWKDSRWITGEWTGADHGRGEIKNDIDRRIQCLADAFQSARNQLNKQQKVVGVHYFVVPEFYFRCLHGPYPLLSIDGKHTYSYILQELERRLPPAPLLPGEVWIVLVGSILTCEEPNIQGLLASTEVAERHKQINSCLARLLRSPNYSKSPPSRILSHKRLEPAQHREEDADINTLMTEFRGNPLCTMHNRGVLLTITQNGVIDRREILKQNESSTDLTMGTLQRDNSDAPLQLGSMVTEWMAGYPSISIYHGDKYSQQSPAASRHTIEQISIAGRPLEIGVELCLDHSLQRLRRTSAMMKATGAPLDNPPLHIQIISSAGMQIIDRAIAAGVNGAIFNCDGLNPPQQADGSEVVYREREHRQVIKGVYSSTAHMSVLVEGMAYDAHSQLSLRYGENEIGGYDNALGSNNAMGATYFIDPETATPKNPALDRYTQPMKIRMVSTVDSSALFAAGLGELHMYVPSNEE